MYVFRQERAYGTGGPPIHQLQLAHRPIQEVVRYPCSMAQARKQAPVDWREGRRQRAWELHQQGWTQKDSAAALGVTQGAVRHWVQRGREGGPTALRRRMAPGSSPRLTVEQRVLVVDALAQGAPAFGVLGEVWTTKRSAAMIKEVFGVSYHPAHVSRLVRALGQRVQLPVTQATRRDEAALRTWWDERWPALKKRPRRKSEPSSG